MLIIHTTRFLVLSGKNLVAGQMILSFFCYKIFVVIGSKESIFGFAYTFVARSAWNGATFYETSFRLFYYWPFEWLIKNVSGKVPKFFEKDGECNSFSRQDKFEVCQGSSPSKWDKRNVNTIQKRQIKDEFVWIEIENNTESWNTGLSFEQHCELKMYHFIFFYFKCISHVLKKP